jgi:hydrogenase maturation factor
MVMIHVGNAIQKMTEEQRITADRNEDSGHA